MASLDAQLADLAAMSPDQLRSTWKRVCKRDAPGFSSDLLRVALAYELQLAKHRDLSAVQKRELRRLGGGQAPALQLKPGTRLMRTWRGRSLAVLVTEQGFLFQARLFTSLSSIAREVTGTAWSGPRFFGLHAKASVRG